MTLWGAKGCHMWEGTTLLVIWVEQVGVYTRTPQNRSPETVVNVSTDIRVPEKPWGRDVRGSGV